MAACTICGEEIPSGSRTCSVCGSSAEDFLPSATMLGGPAPPTPASYQPAELPAGGSYCPVCVRVYGPEYIDPFCSCGTELLKSAPTAPFLDDVPMAPILEDEVPMAPVLDDAPAASGPEVDFAFNTAEAPAPAPVEDSAAAVVERPGNMPAPGTPCLVLYGPNRQPLQYFPLTKDTMLIGRLDAVAGNFPDIELDQWFDRATIRKISRQHALILRSRASRSFALRPLVGNTGTQLEGGMVAPQQDYPLKPGQRIILGGVVRLKFEIM